MSELSELSKLKAKAHQLELKNLHLEARVVQDELNKRLASLNQVSESLAKEFKEEAGSETDFDWDTLKFKEPKKEE